ncbi:MAG: hypothetical protein ACT4PM_02025 [Gemmatimonadales bacterium]
MAHLWLEQSPDWVIIPLDRDELSLTELPPREPGRGVLVKSGAAGRADWHLVAGEEHQIRVNGLPLVTGLRTLIDRDEIRLPRLGTLFFSTERLARVEPLPPEAGQVACPRCRQAIEPGALAVRCPACEVWHHASDELPCWTYAEHCALCRQPTALDTGYQWTPEEL